VSKKRAWWKKISIKGITSALGTASRFLQGGTAAAGAPPPTTVVLQGGTGGLGGDVDWRSLTMVGLVVVGVVVLIAAFRKRG